MLGHAAVAMWSDIEPEMKADATLAAKELAPQGLAGVYRLSCRLGAP